MFIPSLQSFGGGKCNLFEFVQDCVAALDTTAKVNVCTEDMYPTRTIVLLSFIAFFLTKHVVVSQQPDSNAIVALYQSARLLYSERQFQKSASGFRSVANLCPGSELSIQCEYFAAMSDWAVEPSDSCATELSNWLVKAKKFQVDAVAAGRTFDSRQLLKWSENAELAQAKWDRQKQRFDSAEKRLRAFLGFAANSNIDVSPAVSNVHPNAWLELGSLLLENRQDFANARTCFENVIRNSDASESIRCHAKLGCALAWWNTQQYSETRSILVELLAKNLDDELKIQATLLSVKVAKALGETVDVVQALEPVIRVALAGNPPATTLYELAMALIEAGETSQSNEILLRIVHRFPENPVSLEVRVRLARSAAENKRWKESADWSDEAIKLGCSKELQAYAYLLRGQAKLELGSLEQARADLEGALKSSAGDLNLEISIRFQLAETLYLLQRWSEAESHWKWLIQKGQSSPDGARKPDWFPVVLLRSAELLAFRKEWGQAEQIVLRIRNDFPKCKGACEVDYLLARCLVSKADFDAARQVLRSIAQRANATPDELVARGFWMMGETYLMQRMYAEALIAYRDAMAVPNQQYWSSASLLQIAKCCEAMQDLQGAKEAYERIVNQFGESPFVSTAKERLRGLPSVSLANQPPKEPTSGAKR